MTAHLAVLIDADNAQADLIEPLLAEVAKYGVASVKRIYGDWTRPNLNSWKKKLVEHAIQPMQQFGYTTGKNSTDSALIIDAMDLLYTGKFEGFCLVTSDSDFTRLATRLRESGLRVYGFGEKKTPRGFISGCDKFVYVENLVPAAPAGVPAQPAARPPARSATRKTASRNRAAADTENREPRADAAAANGSSGSNGSNGGRPRNRRGGAGRGQGRRDGTAAASAATAAEALGAPLATPAATAAPAALEVPPPAAVFLPVSEAGLVAAPASGAVASADAPADAAAADAAADKTKTKATAKAPAKRAARKRTRRVAEAAETPAAAPAEIEAPAVAAPSELELLLLAAVDACADDTGWAPLGAMGQYISQRRPDFDSRTYGKKRLSDLVKTIDSLSVDARASADGKSTLFLVHRK